MGVDITKPIDGPELMNNTGENKHYPGVPTYHFCGKDVPAFICCSPNDGITSDLSTMMLQ